MLSKGLASSIQQLNRFLWPLVACLTVSCFSQPVGPTRQPLCSSNRMLLVLRRVFTLPLIMNVMDLESSGKQVIDLVSTGSCTLSFLGARWAVPAVREGERSYGRHMTWSMPCSYWPCIPMSSITHRNNAKPNLRTMQSDFCNCTTTQLWLQQYTVVALISDFK